jgi:stage IV sporulation protein FB
MTDPLTWSPISLGRWSGTPVRVHIVLIVFVAFRLLNAAVAPEQSLPPGPTACWLGLLLLALAVHELGHLLMATWLGTEHEEVRLWPLGNLVGPSPGSRSSDNALVALAGPLTSAVLVLVIAVGLNIAGAQLVWNPFGQGIDPGAPFVGKARATALTPLWWFGWFGYLNWVLLIANLIPALPFDGGRLLRAFLANAQVVSAKDNMLAPWTAHTCAALLVLVGLARLILPTHHSDGITLIGLAVLVELMVRAETRILEDGYFEDGVFGYDFTEGYTSLEGNAAKVRPYRESALKRWRRRRSELRRQRQQAREAAEERRMDEILDKLYREGRTALSDDEQRFLVRVSVKYRNRPKARD